MPNAPEPTPKPDGWVHEDFDEWSELTKERDGAREDAIAEQRQREGWGY